MRRVCIYTLGFLFSLGFIFNVDMNVILSFNGGNRITVNVYSFPVKITMFLVLFRKIFLFFSFTFR